MAERKKYKPNTFCWPELATSDASGAKKFYADILGWNFHDDEVAPGMVYTMCLKDDKAAGALFPLNAEMKSQGAAPNWLSYVSVESVDETTNKAKKLGAKVVREPMDVMDVGRMAELQDPTGAVFALWEPKKHIGAQVVNEHGALTWNELQTPDVDRAGKFYTELFGWGADTQDMGSFTYTSYKNGDRPAGGMMPIDQQTMGDVPPNWGVYFAVDQCDKTVEKAKKIGATVIVGPQDIPEVGRFATMIDPQGAVFSVIELANPGE